MRCSLYVSYADQCLLITTTLVKIMYNLMLTGKEDTVGICRTLSILKMRKQGNNEAEQRVKLA